MFGWLFFFRQLNSLITNVGYASKVSQYPISVMNEKDL